MDRGSFTYQALDLTGKLLTGTIGAANKAEALYLLRCEGLFVFRIAPAALKTQWDRLWHCQVRVKELAVCCRQFATMYEAGIPLMQCLLTLAEQTTCNRLRLILQQVAIDIEQGKCLSEAFQYHQDYLPLVVVKPLASAMGI